MFGDIIILLLTGIILLMPLVFWMYIFVTFFPEGISRRQFVLWGFVWMLSTLPFLYHESIFLWTTLTQIFFHLWNLNLSYFGEALYLNLLIFFGVLWWALGIVSFVFQEKKKLFFKIFSISLAAFLLLLFLWVCIILFMSNGYPQSYSGISASFWAMSFMTLGAIVSYYIIISFLEEGLKFLSGLSFGGKKDFFIVFQKYMCLSACIALGFAFYENILYAWNFAQAQGINTWLISLVFFRSIFSVILHLVSSMLFALGFWYIFRQYKNGLKRFLSFSLIASLGLASHVFFDVFLTFGYIGYVFFYIIGIYFFLWYLTSVQTR